MTTKGQKRLPSTVGKTYGHLQQWCARGCCY